MPLAARRERQRAQRHQAIIAAARELAEAEGWDAVTTRRLAERVEYSQPVLYSHFDGRDAIVRAVAIQGFDELAGQLRLARLAANGPRAAARALCDAYMRFAAEHPAVYQAMFVLPTDVKFASDETPLPLRAGFEELVTAVRPYSARPELDAEVLWSALHGMAALSQGSRIPASGRDARLDLLVERLVTGRPGSA
jgi:AcrR family transcriptional regulator